jgi:hypothetical protein
MQKLEDSRAPKPADKSQTDPAVAQPLHTAAEPALAAVQDTPTSSLSKVTVQ